MRRNNWRSLVIGALALSFVVTLIPAFGASAAPSKGKVTIQTSQEIEGEQIEIGASSAVVHPEVYLVPGTADNASDVPFRVLQMNLCNSGVAECYTGGNAPGEGAARNAQNLPHVVTLNEICESDVDGDSLMLTEFAALWLSDDLVMSIFFPVYNREDPPGPVTCTDGRGRFGIALMVHVREEDHSGGVIVANHYPDDIQNPDGNRRAWICYKAFDVFAACSTHLDADDGDTALDQCQYLMGWAIPIWAWGVAPVPTVVGGDFNLGHGFFSDPDVQECVPDGWFRKGDGNVQHIMATDDFTFVHGLRIPMYLTDHPGWLVELSSP